MINPVPRALPHTEIEEAQEIHCGDQEIEFEIQIRDGLQWSTPTGLPTPSQMRSMSLEIHAESRSLAPTPVHLPRFHQPLVDASKSNASAYNGNSSQRMSVSTPARTSVDLWYAQASSLDFQAKRQLTHFSYTSGVRA